MTPATGSSNPTWSFVTDQKKRKVSIRFNHKTGVIVEVSRQVKAAPKVKPATTNTGGM